MPVTAIEAAYFSQDNASVFTSLEQLQKSMEEYINYYNNERIQTKLKGLTPYQARSQALQS